jgi:hypothetical protein
MFSNYRLGGEPLPDDLAILLAHAEELTERTGIELIREEGRAPWLDTSYLSETDRQDPGIMANVGAIADVCALIAFVGSTEDGEHFGYWRGRDRSPLSVSPVVRLDSEGQFRIIAASFAEAVLHQTFGDESFAEVRDWLRSLGIDVRAGSRGEIAGPSTEPSPDELHEESYRRRLGTA